MKTCFKGLRLKSLRRRGLRELHNGDHKDRRIVNMMNRQVMKVLRHHFNERCESYLQQLQKIRRAEKRPIPALHDKTGIVYNLEKSGPFADNLGKQ